LGADPLLGQEFGHYRVLARLGEGGMGVVYLADDLALERRVALKFLSSASTDPAARARLVHEARAAAALLHPGVCPVYEIAEADGRTFIAMAHLDGRTLRERLCAGPLPLAEALAIARQLAEALAAAHAHGIVHRDVKPANVMLLPDGRAVLMDFGLAHLAGATKLTRTGATLGTTAYLAPEQALGREADERSDVWALGVVLYEMAAGRVPFGGEHEAAQLYAIVNAEPEPLAAAAPAAPAGLNGIVSRALAKDPAHRYAQASAMAADLAALERDATARPAGRGRRTRRSWMWQVAVPVLAALALLATLAGLDVGGLRTRLWGGGPAIRALAVLPLANLSGDPGQEYFADGMTSELIDELATISSLRVISRTSSMVYKGARKALPQIARELRVDAVIEGTVERSGDRVRITAELVQARPERNLWGNRYERALGDVLALQSEMAREIARQVRARVTPEERARLAQPRTVNPVAQEAYLKGRCLLPTYDQARCRTALDEFRRSVDIDPSFASGWAGMAEAYYYLSNQSLSPQEAMPRARAAARRAVELDERLADGHAALGVVLAQYDLDRGAAEAELRRAVDLNPSCASAHLYYGYLLSAMARFDEAIREYETASRIDPLSPVGAEWTAWTLHLAGRDDEAIERYRALAASYPADPLPRYSLGWCYVTKRMPERAIAEITVLAGSGDNALSLTPLGCAHALAGRRREALAIEERIRRLPPTGQAGHYSLALVRASLGDAAGAFAELSKSIGVHEEDVNWLAVDPVLARLRGDPRFVELLKRLRLR
jgi:eukaryotic-like serine/threonine-protein kinase